MLRCWQRSPDDRPSFEDLHVILNGILQEEEVKTLFIDKVKKKKERKNDFTIVYTLEA